MCIRDRDIVAKHIPPDKERVRIASLNEMSYRKILWDHQPLTDFWRVGKGYAKKLEQNGLYTMGDIARCSMGKPNEYHNEELLYKLLSLIHIEMCIRDSGRNCERILVRYPCSDLNWQNGRARML